MADIPKRLKRVLREHAGKAHEANLRQALKPLAEAFKRWERNELDSFELSDLIHRFHLRKSLKQSRSRRVRFAAWGPCRMLAACCSMV